VRYPVEEILSTWHLRARWWDSPQHRDRQYWRVQTPDFGVYELYHDQANDV
jgi:hypothetical protein